MKTKHFILLSALLLLATLPLSASAQRRPVVNAKTDQITMFYGNYLVVKNGKKGLVSSNGREIIPALFEKIDLFYGNFLVSTYDNKCGLYTSSGRNIIPVEYNKIDLFHGNYRATRGDNQSLFSTSGKLIISSEL